MTNNIVVKHQMDELKKRAKERSILLSAQKTERDVKAENCHADDLKHYMYQQIVRE